MFKFQIYPCKYLILFVSVTQCLAASCFLIFVFVSVIHCTVDSDSSEEEIVILTANEVRGGHENR